MSATSSTHIPAELWEAIWLRLGLADRVTASRVCTQWRAIALESHDLWRDVHVHAPLSIEDCSEHQHSPCMPLALPILLERSGESTISLFLSDRGSSNDMHDLLKALEPHLHRVARLKLYYGAMDCLDIVTMSIPRWPALRQLETVCLKGVDEGERNWKCSHTRQYTAFTGIQMPVLEDASFSPDHDLITRSLCCLSTTLTRLRIEITTVVGLIPALEQCPNLLWLRVGFWGCHSSSSNPDYEAEEHRARAHDLAKRIPEIVIAVIDEETKERAIEVFPGLPTRRSLHLVHRRTHEKSVPHRLFDGLQGMLTVTVLVTLAVSDTPGITDTRCIDILVVDAYGMERKVTLLEGYEKPAVLLLDLLTLLEGRIERIEADAELWQEAMGEPNAEEVEP